MPVPEQLIQKTVISNCSNEHTLASFKM